MTLEALLASLHLLAILTLVVFLSSEAALCRPEWLNAAVVERLPRVDLFYGLAVALVLIPAAFAATRARRRMRAVLLVGVTGYGAFQNGSQVGSPTATSYTFTGLSCGTSYTLAVDAADAALPQGSKAAADRLLAGARPTTDNAYKVPLVERTLAAVIAEARTSTGSAA